MSLLLQPLELLQFSLLSSPLFNSASAIDCSVRILVCTLLRWAGNVLKLEQTVLPNIIDNGNDLTTLQQINAGIALNLTVIYLRSRSTMGNNIRLIILISILRVPNFPLRIAI